MVSESDILASPLLPAEHKVIILERYRQLRFVLGAPERSGSGFAASGASHADRLVAAEQLARISLVFFWYVDFFRTRDRSAEDDDEDEECESMATDLMHAGLCASGWQGTWDQPCFVTPLCLLGREQEVAELTSWCLSHFGRASSSESGVRTPRSRGNSSLSADRIQEFWQCSPQPTEIISTRAKKPTLLPIAHVDWVGHHDRRRARARSEGDILHAAEVWSAEQNDLDHEIWTQWAKDARSPTEEIEILWPPPRSLAGYCLMEKLSHRQISIGLPEKKWVLETSARYVRAALHLWCLRCYRLRCKTRTFSPGSQLRAALDMAFMFFGMWIVLAVEIYVSWTDGRVPKDAGLAGKVQGAWSIFLESDVHPATYCGKKPDPAPPPGRRRSISCPS